VRVYAPCEATVAVHVGPSLQPLRLDRHTCGAESVLWRMTQRLPATEFPSVLRLTTELLPQASSAGRVSYPRPGAGTMHVSLLAGSKGIVGLLAAVCMLLMLQLSPRGGRISLMLAPACTGLFEKCAMAQCSVGGRPAIVAVVCDNAPMSACAGLVDVSEESNARVGPVASWKDFPIRFGPAVRRLVEADESEGAEERMIVAAVQDPGEA
jgi:hypothetical protein